MMNEALVLLLTLLTVKQIDTQPNGAVVTFAEGQSGRVLATHKNYDYYLRLANDSLKEQEPIGISLTAKGQIVEIEDADSDIPTSMIDVDQERVQIIFQGHAGIYYLLKNNPRFKQLSELLHQSIQDKTRVWFVAQHPWLNLMDVINYAQ